jgi:hypothetical protein
MVQHYADATSASVHMIMDAYDRLSEDTMITVLGLLPPVSGIDLVDKLVEAADEADRAWPAILARDESPQTLLVELTAGRATSELPSPRLTARVMRTTPLRHPAQEPNASTT